MYRPSAYFGGRILCNAVPAIPQSGRSKLLHEPSGNLYLVGAQLEKRGHVSASTVDNKLNLGNANVPCSGDKLNLQHKNTSEFIQFYQYTVELLLL